jgi:hypothetical protein
MNNGSKPPVFRWSSFLNKFEDWFKINDPRRKR